MNNDSKVTKEYIKQRTLELYKSLPQDEEERKKRIDVRDEVIQLNYAFFGYVASHTFINNTSVTYDDKFQSALMHFCECWWWYLYEKKYRTDLSFTVFFKLRIGEMIERELNEVKYSVRRALCMEAGKQLGKHWGQVRYEDLKDVNLPVDKMNSLKAIFGSLYFADLEKFEPYLESPESPQSSPFDEPTDNYNTIEDMLMHEMVTSEKKLTPKDLREMSNMLDIPISLLEQKLPVAEKMLYTALHKRIDIDNIN